jgi:para-nitrobenzyl esterase
MRHPAVLSVALVATLLTELAPASHAQEPVRLRSGLVRGSRDGDLVIYKGIPYAAPPLGDLRWKPPQPARRWDGVREATTFSLPCAQSPFPPGTRPGPWAEDCLTINVWAPLAKPDTPLPVLVVIPGGGFFTGGSGERLNDGSNLAKHGIIVVSFNYRLGVFGFFAHPVLSKESATHVSGNYGLMDQVAALHWVHDNIAAFGGDARTVTITGSSAGGSSVLYLMVSPLAKGLFVRGIAESSARVYGPLAFLTERRYGRDSREAQGSRLGADIAALRALPADEVHRRAALETNFMFADGPDYWPMVDGAVLPDEPWKLFEAGRFARVPLLIGTTADEGSLFALANSMKSREAWADHLARRHPGAEAAVQAAYAVAADSDVYPTARRWVNDWYFHGTARAVARAVAARDVPVFLFDFSRVSPYQPISGRNMGAFHAFETNYIFGNFPPPAMAVLTEADRALSATMMNSWLQFIRTGDPNVAGLPTWPRYTRSGDQHMDFGAEIRVGSGLHSESLDAFDTAFAQMRAASRAARQSPPARERDR